MAATEIFDPSGTESAVHHKCGNFDPKHMELRKKSVGGSAIGTYAGHSKYDDPQKAWLKHIGILPQTFSEPCDHGHKCEPESGRILANLMKEHYPHITQVFDVESGYDMPKLGSNKIFTDEIDCNHNGCSIDRRGKVVDAEIKNPFIYTSWKNNYDAAVMPTVFDQCQHTMAVRGRKWMILFCTSFAKHDPTVLLAECMWEIRFSEEYYTKHLKGPGRIVAEALHLHSGKSLDDISIPTHLEGLPKQMAEEFAQSEEWISIRDACCIKKHRKVYGDTCRRYFESLSTKPVHERPDDRDLAFTALASVLHSIPIERSSSSSSTVVAKRGSSGASRGSFGRKKARGKNSSSASSPSVLNTLDLYRML
jgi:hypothetical protein